MTAARVPSRLMRSSRTARPARPGEGTRTTGAAGRMSSTCGTGLSCTVQSSPETSHEGAVNAALAEKSALGFAARLLAYSVLRAPLRVTPATNAKSGEIAMCANGDGADPKRPGG